MKTLFKSFAIGVGALLWFVTIASADVAQSEWTVTDGDGDITIFTFHNNARCSYFRKVSNSGNQGRTNDNCRWRQNENVLSFDTNNHYWSAVAIVVGGELKGHYVTNWNNHIDTLQGTRN